MALSSPVPFDFIVNNELLRCSLHKYIEDRNISKETVLIVEYLPAQSISNEVKSIDTPSWIGSLSKIAADGSIAAGGYDGQLRLFDRISLAGQSSFSGHEQPIRCVTSFQAFEKNLILTGSKDQTVKCWNYFLNKKGKSSCNVIANLNGSLNSIECIDISITTPTMILCGDWNGNLLGYNISSLQLIQQSEDEGAREKEPSLRKKKKINSGASVDSRVENVNAIFSHHAHTQAISSVQYSASDSHRAFTSSWDHSVKYWDIERLECIDTHAGGKVVTSLHFNDINGLVATSHPDGRIRLWDSRKQNRESSHAMSFTSANSWISQVQYYTIL